MSLHQSWPWLPVEVIARILSDLWSSQLSADERISIITSCSLVNKMWLDLFTRISMTDVYVPCPSYAQHYLRIIRRERPVCGEVSKELPQNLCRSLNFEVHSDSPAKLLPRGKGDMGSVVSSLLYQIDRLEYLPNLRRVSIDYIEMSNEAFNLFTLSDLPKQVDNLSVNYILEARTLSSRRPLVFDTMRTQYHRQPDSWWLLSDIGRLAVYDMGEDCVAEIFEIFPDAKTPPVEHPDPYASLPASLHELMTYTPPEIVVGAEEMNKMNLEEAVEAGAFSLTSTESQLKFVHSGVSDGFEWEKARIPCDRRVLQLARCIS